MIWFIKIRSEMMILFYFIFQQIKLINTGNHSNFKLREIYKLETLPKLDKKHVEKYTLYRNILHGKYLQNSENFLENNNLTNNRNAFSHRILDSNYCSQFTNCFNCSTYSGKLNDCEWNGKKKCEPSENKKTDFYWWNKSNLCNKDMNSIAIQKKYCSSQNLPLTLNNISGTFGLNNMYCNWSFIANDEFQYYKITLDSLADSINDLFYIELTFQDENPQYIQIEGQFFSATYLNLESVNLHYLSTSRKLSNPFLFNIEGYSHNNIFVISLSLGLFLLVLVIILIVYCWLRRKRANQNFQNNIIVTEEARLESYNKIIIDEAVVEVDIVNNNTSEICVICHENIILKHMKIKKCNHFFHEECIKKWLLIRRKCPVCVTEI